MYSLKPGTKVLVNLETEGGEDRPWTEATVEKTPNDDNGFNYVVRIGQALHLRRPADVKPMISAKGAGA